MKYFEILEMFSNSVRSVKQTLESKSCYNYEVANILNEKFGNPATKMKLVHIAGTNGKGSVGMKLSKAFSLAGYKVGVFSSPHLTCYRERIRINGEFISEADFARIAEKVIKSSLECSLQPIFFETICMMAFIYFAEQKVDVAIIEAGIGGRLDSTNFISPILSIITNIDYDHIPFLGNNLEDIAYQKAGIIKKDTPVVLGPSAQTKVILDEAKEKDAQTIFSCASGGFFDDENIDIAALSLKVLSKTFPKLTDDIICQGVKQRPNARFEVIPSFFAKRLSQDFVYPEYIVLDVAHNIGGMKAVFEAINLKLASSKIRVLIGLSSGKEHKKLYSFLTENAVAIHVLPIKHMKLEDPQHVKNRFSEEYNYEKIYYNPDLKRTLQEAFLLAKENDETVLICGSFFIMADVRKALGYNDVLDEVPKALV